MLEKKLATDPSAILNEAEVRLLNRELQRVIASSLAAVPTDMIDRADDAIRWHALGVRCAQARGARGIRDAAIALGIPQYRLRAIESGRINEFRLDFAKRYFRFLAIEEWVERWCRANRKLASRIGLMNGYTGRTGKPRRDRRRGALPAARVKP